MATRQYCAPLTSRTRRPRFAPLACRVPQGQACQARAHPASRHRAQRALRRRRRHRIPARLQARLREHCVEAARLALSIGSVSALGEGQKSKSASGKARGRRGLGFPALDQEPQADSGHARGVLRSEEPGRRSAARLLRVIDVAVVVADDEAGGLFLDGIEFSLLTWRILTWRSCVDAAVNGFRSGGRHRLRREYGSWGRHGLRREYGSSRMHGHYPSPAMVAPGCRPAIRNSHLHTLVRVKVCYPQQSAKWQYAACGGELVAVVRRTTGSRTYSVCAKGSLPDHHAPPVSPLLRNRSRRLLLGHARVAMRPIRWGCLLLRTAQ